MSFTQEFMLHVDRFREELDALHIFDDWRTFCCMRLDDTACPSKNPQMIHIPAEQ